MQNAWLTCYHCSAAAAGQSQWALYGGDVAAMTKETHSSIYLPGSSFFFGNLASCPWDLLGPWPSEGQFQDPDVCP